MKIINFELRNACESGDVNALLKILESRFDISSTLKDCGLAHSLSVHDVDVMIRKRSDMAIQLIMPPSKWAASSAYPVSKIFEWIDGSGFAWTYVSALESHRPLLKIFCHLNSDACL